MKCDQAKCVQQATHRVFWPGSPPRFACLPCTLRFKGASEAMGFFLHVELLPEHLMGGEDSEDSEGS